MRHANLVLSRLPDPDDALRRRQGAPAPAVRLAQEQPLRLLRLSWCGQGPPQLRLGPDIRRGTPER